MRSTERTSPSVRRVCERSSLGRGLRVCRWEGNRGWRSWARDTPSAKTLTVDMYPDLSEFSPSDLWPVQGFKMRARPWNARQAGARMLKIAMFDEVNESKAVFKLAPERQDAPEQGYRLTLDADGEDLPSDWYLKLSGEITKRFHGEPGSPAFPLTFPTGRQ